MNKTFSEFLTENPTFWDSHNYPAAVKAIVNDWFYYREICSNTKFNKMFGRKLDILKEQFDNFYDKTLELDFDPSVVEAIERSVERAKNESINDTIEKTIAALTGNTRTLNTDTAKTGTERTITDGTTTNNLTDLRTLANSHTKTGTEGVQGTNTGTVQDAGTESRTQYNSDYPMSSPTLGFENYVSTGVKADGTTGNTRTDNLASSSTTTFNTTDGDSGTITDAHTGTIDNDNDTTTTHNTNLAETGTISDSGSENTTHNETAERAVEGTDSENEIVERKGVIVELFDKYFSLVKKTNAVEWLLNKLDVCFVQVFDIDEEEDEETSGSSAEIAELERRVQELTLITASLIAGEDGPYRIFGTYSDMIAASASIASGTTMFVKADDNQEDTYHDDGSGANTTTLRFKKNPNDSSYTEITVSVGATLERLSPEYNPELYTYMSQFYELPENLSEIYDHYTIFNNYGSQVYTYYSYDSAVSYYIGTIDFNVNPNPPGTRNNSYFAKDKDGDIVFVKQVN